MTGCESSNVGEGIIKMKKEKEELETIKERMGRMESALQASQESVQQLSSNLAQQEDEMKSKDEAVAVLQQELDTCRSQITALETSLGHFHQQEDQVTMDTDCHLNCILSLYCTYVCEARLVLPWCGQSNEDG